VPACDKHNQAYSQLDEQFREFVSFMVGSTTPETRTLRHDTARAMRRSRRRLEAFIKGIRSNQDKGTFEVPQRLSVMRAMAERITRGLYWHRFGEPMPTQGEIRSTIISDPTQIKTIVEGMFGQLVADGQFAYVLERAPDNPSVVVCYLSFHARMIVSVIADWSRDRCGGGLGPELRREPVNGHRSHWSGSRLKAAFVRVPRHVGEAP
jgi:hypothetical protein